MSSSKIVLRVVFYAAFIATVAATTFVGHRYLTSLYVTHCRSNVLRVLLFSNSRACVGLASGIDLIEAAYRNILGAAHVGLVIPIARSFLLSTPRLHRFLLS